MNGKWTSWGRGLAGVCLAMCLGGCALEEGLIVGAPIFGQPWPGSYLNDEGKVDSGAPLPGPTVEAPGFVALYQTSQGPLLNRMGKLYRVGRDGLTLWGAAPREGMAWSVAMLSSTEAWSVGPEGISRLRKGIWEVVVNRTHSLLSPASNQGETVNLTDVAFADASRGYAVGTHGMVLAYDGITWSKVDVKAFGKRHFGSVRIGDDGDVWVAGEDVFCLEGGTWTSVGLPEPGAMVSGLVVLSDAVWASTGDALWKWDKATRTWAKPQPDLIEGFVGSPQRVPASSETYLAWAMDVGNPGGLLYRLTAEGSWEKATLSAPSPVGLDALVLLDAETGFALSYDGSTLYAFTEGRWTAVSF